MPHDYIVQPGDQLSKIAAKYGLTLARLLELNPKFKANPDLIFAGQSVRLPENGSTVVDELVQKGLAALVQKTKEILEQEALRNQPIDNICEECGCSEYDKCLVTAVTGPVEATVGDKATYSVTGYDYSGELICCKKRVKWRVELYSTREERVPVRVIEDCAAVPEVFAVEEGSLTIKAVPSFWYCYIRVFPYVVKPTIAVSQETRVRIKPKLLAEFSRDYDDDLKYGDYDAKQFEPLYLKAQAVCRKGAEAICASPIVEPLSFTPWGAERVEECVERLCPSFKSFIAKSDDELFSIVENLVAKYSMWACETIVLDMVKKVKENKGGEYKSGSLNAETRDHDSPKKFIAQIKERFEAELSRTDGQFDKVGPIALDDRVRFSSFIPIEWLSGLGIMINDTDGYKIEVVDYACLLHKKYRAKIKITIYDHFGIDVADVTVDNPNEPRRHMKMEPIGFMAWFYLQRVRGYRPLLTVIENEYEIEGGY